MRIGLLLTVYNCEKYIKDCLDPWFELKENHEVVISANSGMFSDYHTLGIPFRNQETLKILSEYDIDFLITTKGKNLLGEDESRNLCLNFINKQECDLIWVLDGDECYTKDQILNILKFIEENPDLDRYELNFKNLTIEENLFMDYKHSRIVWAKRHGGISHFYFDNQFVYNNGTDTTQTSYINIPKNVAYIKHYSWLSDDSRTKDKIAYQRYRYRYGPGRENNEEIRCSYSWNSEKNKLEFNRKFYKHFGQEIPCLHEEISCFSYDFDINYSRTNKCFYITNVQKEMNTHFEIYDNFNNMVYSTQMFLSKGVNYFIQTKVNNTKFGIKAYVDNYLIHDEKIHLNNHHNINLIIGSAHIEDNKRIEDYKLSFDNIKKFKNIFNNITIIETISKEKVTYLEDSGFDVYYSELQNIDIDKGINWMNHIKNFVKDGNKDDINVCLTGRYLLEDNNSILKIIDDYMINDDYEFIAKNGGDIYNGVYDGKIIHSFLFFFKKDKFLEFSIFLENNKSNYGAIECDINDFLKISEKCKILPTEYYLGVKTNYYYEKNQYII